MTAKQDDPNNLLVHGLHLDRMVERPGGNLSASANESLERFRATCDVNDLQVQPGFPEIAQLLGNRERCILQECLAANRHPYRGRLWLGLLRPDVVWRR